MVAMKPETSHPVEFNTDPRQGLFLMGMQPTFMPFHVIPMNDSKEHDHMNFQRCHCYPRVQLNERVFVIVHNAFDGRA